MKASALVTLVILERSIFGHVVNETSTSTPEINSSKVNSWAQNWDTARSGRASESGTGYLEGQTGRQGGAITLDPVSIISLLALGENWLFFIF